MKTIINRNKHLKKFQVAKLVRLVLDYPIIQFNVLEPTLLSSGILSPIYCDFREALGYPDLMRLIEKLFCASITKKKTSIIAGVATGGVPYAAGIARALSRPLCYIRSDSGTKEHGLKKRIEGATVNNKTVYLIEDCVSSGKSIISGMEALREAGASHIIPLSIFSYNLEGVHEKTALAPLITITDLLPELKIRLSPNEYTVLEVWLKNPRKWKP